MTNECSLDLDALLARRAIIEWRDRHLLAGQHTLLQLALDLERELFERIDHLEWSDLTGDVYGYVVEVLAPLVRERASQVVSKLVATAETELKKVSTDDATVACVLDINSAQPAASDGFAWLIPDRVARELPNLGITLSKASEKPAAIAGAAFNGMSRLLSKTPINSLADSRRKTYHDRAQELIVAMIISTGSNPPSSCGKLAASLHSASTRALTTARY